MSIQSEFHKCRICFEEMQEPSATDCRCKDSYIHNICLLELALQRTDAISFCDMCKGPTNYKYQNETIRSGDEWLITHFKSTSQMLVCWKSCSNCEKKICTCNTLLGCTAQAFLNFVLATVIWLLSLFISHSMSELYFFYEPSSFYENLHLLLLFFSGLIVLKHAKEYIILPLESKDKRDALSLMVYLFFLVRWMAPHGSSKQFLVVLFSLTAWIVLSSVNLSFLRREYNKTLIETESTFYSKKKIKWHLWRK